jgi:endo-alpha-1,4-polygalactosaminidase (GH114 family)
MTIKSYINRLEDRDIIGAYVECVIHQYEDKVGTADVDKFMRLEYEDFAHHVDTIIKNARQTFICYATNDDEILEFVKNDDYIELLKDGGDYEDVLQMYGGDENAMMIAYFEDLIEDGVFEHDGYFFYMMENDW